MPVTHFTIAIDLHLPSLSPKRQTRMTYRTLRDSHVASHSARTKRHRKRATCARMVQVTNDNMGSIIADKLMSAFIGHDHASVQSKSTTRQTDSTSMGSWNEGYHSSWESVATVWLYIFGDV